MRKIISLLWFVGVFLTNGLTLVAQQQKPETASETEFRILKEQYQQLLEKDEKVVAQYENIIRELKEERKAHLGFVENTYKWITGIASAALLIFGILISFFGWKSYKKVKKDVDSVVIKKCTKMIADVVSGKKDIISKQIEKYDLQAKLRKNNKIIILSENLEVGSEIEGYLKEVGFTVDKAVINAYYDMNGSSKQDLKKWNVVIFNNLKGNWNEKKVQEKLVNSNIDKSILFYLGERIEDENKKFNVSAVNMPSQLYGNLMNLLEYRNAQQG